MNVNSILALCLFVIFTTTSAFASELEDMKGSSDHPDLPRISGSTIVGYYHGSYDELPYLEGERTDLRQNTAKGNATKIMYLMPSDQPPTSVMHNYRKAFEDLGEFTPSFSCTKQWCDKELGKVFIWGKHNRFKTIYEHVDVYFFNYAHLYKNQVYLSGEIKADTGVYLVSIYAAENAKDNRVFKGDQTLAVLQVVKTEDFKAELEVVEAEEIGSKIKKSGHVALYGLFFETDKDVLMSTSKPALDEVANYLKLSPDTNVYVVGHTDNVGEVAYNQDLSLRRARSITKNLIEEYGISGNRVTPLGAGLAAPVATNKTEEGRAKNRRVELVKR